MKPEYFLDPGHETKRESHTWDAKQMRCALQIAQFTALSSQLRNTQEKSSWLSQPVDSLGWERAERLGGKDI